MPIRIQRVWRAYANDFGEAYRRHFEEHVLPMLLSVPGFIPARLLRRKTDEPQTELLVESEWDSLKAIEGFAGRDLGRAVVANEAASCLTEWEKHVTHYEVISARG